MKQPFAALARQRWLPWAGLTAAVLTVQSGILAGDFYADDYFYLHLLRAGAGPFAMFARDLWFGLYFRPGLFPLLWLIHAAAGPRAAAFLAVNVALLTATTLLFFALGRRWFASTAVAFWAALLFGIAPAATIGAHFVWNMNDTLGALLLVASLYCFWRWLQADGRAWLIAAAPLALWSMLCKENMAALAPLATLAAWSNFRRALPIKEAAVAALRCSWLPWAVLAVYLAWRTAMLGGVGGYLPLDQKGFDARVLPVLGAMLLQYYALSIPLLAAAAAVWVVVLGADRQCVWRPALLGLAIMLVATLPFLPNLNNKIMVLWLPLRFFYLPALGSALFYASIADGHPKLRPFAHGALAVLAIVLAANSWRLAWDFSGWQTRNAQFLQQTGKQVKYDFAAAPVGSVFYLCGRVHEHGLDAGVKFYYPEFVDRYVLLHCNDRTEVVTRPEVAALAPSPLYWDKMLRRNPATYGGLLYGVAGANIKKAQSDEAASPNAHRLVAPPRDDRVTDRFMPQGREPAGRRK